LNYGYLLPYDADVDAPFVKGICIQELKRLFLESKVNSAAIIILDCCYSGIATTSRGGSSEDVKAIYSLNELLQSGDTGSGRFILASARADEKAREKKQKHAPDGDEHVHGLYSFHLIEALKGQAADEHGYVSLGSVIRHIDDVFRTTHPVSIPPISAAGVDMDGIWLTVIPSKVAEHLEQRYTLIAEFINNNTARNILCAIDQIIDLENRGTGKKEKITEYLVQIDESIKGFRPKCVAWWFDNSSNLRGDPYVDNIRWFPVLQDVLTDLTIENYRKRDRRTRGFLTEIIEAIVEGRDYRSVTKYMEDDKRKTLSLEPARRVYGIIENA
jgi:hypothetical protein